MNKYRIFVSTYGKAFIDVEAESLEKARDLADSPPKRISELQDVQLQGFYSTGWEKLDNQ